MSRIPLCSAPVLATLALAACATAPPPPPPPPHPMPTLLQGQADVTLHAFRCEIDPKVVVIDWGDELPGPKEVTWERDTIDRNAKFFFDPKEPNKNLFPGLPGKFASNNPKRMSGKPSSEPPWNLDSDGDGVNESYLYKYLAKRNVLFGRKCDPDICIRKKQTGCAGY